MNLNKFKTSTSKVWNKEKGEKCDIVLFSKEKNKAYLN